MCFSTRLRPEGGPGYAIGYAIGQGCCYLYHDTMEYQLKLSVYSRVHIKCQAHVPFQGVRVHGSRVLGYIWLRHWKAVVT